jgi:Mg/Co/Ni transporter MgtE
MSPRAAWRLERLGFPAVYDYVAGKMDWLSFGLAHEGAAVLAGDAVERDVPTCGLDERVGDVAKRVADRSASFCIATNDAGIVMGVVQGHALVADPDALVDDIMQFGTATVRPSEDLAALLQRMRDRGVDAIVVTRSDARLVGILTREQAERAST